MPEADKIFDGSSRFQTGVTPPQSHVFLRPSHFPHFCRSASVARWGAGERQWRKMRALGLVVVHSWPREISVRAIYCKIFPISGVSHGYRALVLGCHWSLVLLLYVHPPPNSLSLETLVCGIFLLKCLIFFLCSVCLVFIIMWQEDFLCSAIYWCSMSFLYVYTYIHIYFLS